MAVWSKALPLTASCLSPLCVGIPPGACEKVASDLGLCGGFHGYSGFLSYNCQVTTDMVKVTKIEI